MLVFFTELGMVIGNEAFITYPFPLANSMGFPIPTPAEGVALPVLMF
jgi:hypothetical protein